MLNRYSHIPHTIFYKNTSVVNIKSAIYLAGFTSGMMKLGCNCCACAIRLSPDTRQSPETRLLTGRSLLFTELFYKKF